MNADNKKEIKIWLYWLIQRIACWSWKGIHYQ